MLKKIKIALLTAAILISTLSMTALASQEAPPSLAPHPGGNLGNSVWFSFYDWQAYLRGKNQAEFTQAFDNICKTVKNNGCSSLFVHVRSHNDAAYYSRIYPFTTTMLNGDPGFDPLTIMPQIAHNNGIQFHAWLNPYGFRSKGYSGSQHLATHDNIVNGVREILAYGVDGIHFDDYFPPHPVEVHNRLIKEVYDVCHQSGKIFGISPGGNYQTNLPFGVATWLSTPGYIDYIVPQLYWSNNYGKAGGQTLYNDRMAPWLQANTAGIPMYTGLALYKAGEAQAGDLGWSISSNNLKSQWDIAKSVGFRGYALFRYANLLSPATQAELNNLRMP